MSDIFISYARADSQQAALLAEKFIQNGWSVWWDREIPPGRSFDEVIEEALNAAKCVIVIWSQQSVASRWVKTEAAEGAARGVLVPVLIEGVKIPLEFKRIEAANLSDWRGNTSHPEFSHLIRTIDSLLTDAAKPNPAQISEPEPSLIKRNGAKSWLLGGLMVVAAMAGLSLIYMNRSALFDKPEQAVATSVSSSVTDFPPAHPEQAIAATPEPIPELPAQTQSINLLAPENGVQLLAASSDEWLATINGIEDDLGQISYGLGQGAVYGFKDDRAATFHAFGILISGTGSNNVKQFELFFGNESPTGSFISIGKFETQNLKLFKTPFQTFTFPPVTAKYFKLKLIDSYGFTHPVVHEIQLFGHLK